MALAVRLVRLAVREDEVLLGCDGGGRRGPKRRMSFWILESG
jgi:hypothetical protein